MTFPAKLLDHARMILKACEKKGLVIATAESCTGGLIGAVLTEESGASAMFRYGYITYHNKAKTRLLGVKKELLKKHGAVSEACAIAMARGALKHSKADIAVAVTGIAGPTGATKDKPVGLVHIAAVRKGSKPVHTCRRFKGDRSAVRLQAVEAALSMIASQLK